MRKKAVPVMRKPYKTLTFGNIDTKPLQSHGLRACGDGVISEGKTQKRVYLEPI